MGWNEYQKRLTVKHDFGEFGCKEFWVKLRRVDSLPYGESMDADAMTPEELKQAREEARHDKKKAEELRKRSERDLVGSIVEWYITDPTIQGDPDVSEEAKKASLPVPTEEDSSSLANIPLEFVFAMMEWIEADSDIAKKVSKRTGTSSGRP